MSALPRYTVGLFGKLPAHGDFLRRGLPGSFCAQWDTWLRRGMTAAEAQFDPEAWAEIWRAAPAWRFALPAGACGPDAVAGVLVASFDSVGRRFPLTLACQQSTAGPGVAWPAHWFAALEGAALAGRDDGLDADTVMSRLPLPEEVTGPAVSAPGWWTADTEAGPGLVWRLPSLPSPDEFALLMEPST